MSIALPSASHRTRKLGFSIPVRSARRFEPSASITTSDVGSLLLGQVSLALQACEKNATFVPSGDHAGAKSVTAPSVSSRRFEPSPSAPAIRPLVLKTTTPRSVEATTGDGDGGVASVVAWVDGATAAAEG